MAWKTGRIPQKRLLLALIGLVIIACIALPYVRKDKFPYVGQWVCHFKYKYGPAYNTVLITVTPDKRCFITQHWVNGVTTKAECSYVMHADYADIVFKYKSGHRDRNGIVTSQDKSGLMKARITPQDKGQTLVLQYIKLDYQLEKDKGRWYTKTYSDATHEFGRISDSP